METVVKGITREVLYDGRVMVYTVEALNINAIVDWSRAIVASLENWPADSDYIAIHDLSKTGMSMQFLMLTGYNILDVALTPASQKRVELLLKSRPNMRIHLAVVLSSAMSGQITMGRGRSSLPDHERVESRVFSDRESAMEWIAELLPT